MTEPISNAEPITSVLYVDDDRSQREFITRILADVSGMTVHAVETLEEGVALGGNYDVILLDLFLPGLHDPLEGLRRMIASFPDKPIVVFTVDSTLAQAALRSGATDYIAKQFDVPSLLSQSLKNAFLKHQQDRTLLGHIAALDSSILGRSPVEEMRAITERMKALIGR